MTPLILTALTLTATAQDKIVNGTEALPGEFPEVVNVVAGGTCTGSVIHPEWVLTAAHCFDGVDLSENPDGNATINFGVGGLVGFEQSILAEAVVVHPRYISLSNEGVSANSFGQTREPAPDGITYNLMTHDMALVKLSQPYTGTLMALNVNPIDDSWIEGQVKVTQIGFGITSTGASDSGTKRHVDDVPIIFYSGLPPEGNWAVTFEDVETNKGICQGDSGGPSVIRSGEDSYFQIGVTSYGRTCGLDPATSMRVDPYIPWILGARDDAMDDGVITEDEYLTEADGDYYRDPSLWVPSILTGAAGPPRFQCSHQLNPEEANSIAIGVVPFELRCSATQPDFETLEQIVWNWGDGSAADVRTTDLETAEHEYTEMGVYTIRTCFEGLRGDFPYSQCVFKQNHVNACDVPEAIFEAEPMDDLRIGLRNLTSLQAHNCITNAQWDVYQGDTATGEPVLTLSGWEPTPELDEPGDYTVVLHVGGLAGTAAASAPVKVRRAVGSACSATTAAPLVGLMALLPLFGLRRRD